MAEPRLGAGIWKGNVMKSSGRRARHCKNCDLADGRLTVTPPGSDGGGAVSCRLS